MRRHNLGAFLLPFAFLCLWPSLALFGAQLTNKAPQEWMTDESMRLYLEAITQLRKQMLVPSQSIQIVRDTLKAYLRSLDPFSDYLSPEEYKQYKAFQAPQYAGVGMEIEAEKSGRIVCLPYPESPAIQAGIEAGDVLEAVDDVSTADLSILTVGLKIRGQVGTEVWLKVSKTDGGQKDIHIIRTSFEAKSVLVEQQGTLPIVRLLAFTPRTSQELQSAFRALQNATTVVLDLRSNPGGSFLGAINSAKLFLARGQKIAGLKTQEGLQEYRNDLSASDPIPATLYLWQDERTASAAEVFIAALSQNQRAVSLGQTTFGKGAVQEIIALSDGSALYLTIGYIQTPDGTLYHKHGLKPTYPLDLAPAKTTDYVAKVTALMKQKAVGKPAVTEPHSLQKSQPLDIQITLNAPSSSSAPRTLSQVALLCFEKDFESDRDAEVWSMEVRASLRERSDHYLLQRKKADGIKFVVCLGPFKSKEEAETKRSTLSDAMQTPMFAEEVEKTAFQE